MTRWISWVLAGMALATAGLHGQTAPLAPPRGSPPPAKPGASAPAPARGATTTLGPGTYAHFTTTHGEFVARLFDKDVPNAVANFVGLATGKKAWLNPRTRTYVHRPFYNNLTFHRVIPAFMIQGGDPTDSGMGGAGYEFADEITSKYRHNKAGILSMANHGPNTNSSQFFITVAPYPSLDGRFTIFGEIVQGLDKVVAISRVPRGPDDRPRTPVVIKTVRIQVVP